MFQYTHLIRKYSLRSSNRARLNPEKMTIWSIFMTFFLTLQLTQYMITLLLATMVLFKDVSKFSRYKQ